MQFDLSKQSYCFAIPAYEGEIRVETQMSLLGVSTKLSSMGVAHSFAIIKGGALIHNVRNELVYKFLNQSDCDTMVWIDADVGFEFEAFARLAAWSSLYPIVAGVYPSRTDPPTFFVNHLGEGYNEHGLIKVNGTGMGFVAIQRQVFEKMKVLQYRSKAYPTPLRAYFQMDYVPTEEMYEGEVVMKSQGEDIWFFQEAFKQGFPTYVDPKINLTHTGPKTFDGRLQDCISQIINP